MAPSGFILRIGDRPTAKGGRASLWAVAPGRIAKITLSTTALRRRPSGVLLFRKTTRVFEADGASGHPRLEAGFSNGNRVHVRRRVHPGNRSVVATSYYNKSSELQWCDPWFGLMLVLDGGVPRSRSRAFARRPESPPSVWKRHVPASEAVRPAKNRHFRTTLACLIRLFNRGAGQWRSWDAAWVL